MPATYLDRIVEAHREAARADRRKRGAIEEAAEKAMADGPCRGLRSALAAVHATGVGGGFACRPAPSLRSRA